MSVTKKYHEKAEAVIVNSRPETNLCTADFDFDLPQELIAQTPLQSRDSSRLMVVRRQNEGVEHKVFSDIIDELCPEDMLVVNASKVIAARLLGTCDRGGAPMELLLLRALEGGCWETLVRPGKRAKVGATFTFGDGILKARVEEVFEDGNRAVRFTYNSLAYTDFYAVLDRVGNMPLPPYIKEKLKDKTRYQTVYAKEEGSAAAPTAGLHFTRDLLDRIRAKGVGYGEVTLHVGLGTFRPVKESKIADHEMHFEHFKVSKEVCDEINRRRNGGGRLICVGTTSCRVIESIADENGTVHPMEGDTGIFIFPGYRFKATDALITNFHLPQSTLLMLVSALAGRERMLDAYAHAVREGYRFFSFGDAMFIC